MMDWRERVAQIVHVIFNDLEDEEPKTGFVLVSFPFSGPLQQPGVISTGDDQRAREALQKALEDWPAAEDDPIGRDGRLSPQGDE